MSDETTPARVRQPRTLPQKLGSIVLGFESIVVALGGLTIFGLKPAGIEPWWGIVGGGVVALLMIATAGAITKPWAIPMGWALQVIVALSAFLIPTMAIVALVFGGMWAYATIGGARLDKPRPTTPTTNNSDRE